MNLQVKGNAYLDLAGHTLTGDLTGDGTLYLMDSSSDKYQTPTGAIAGTVSCQLADNFKTDITGSVRRYMVLAADTGYTAHRFYLGITKLSIRTGDVGFGYKAVLYGDSQVLDRISSFGFRLQLEGQETVVTKTVENPESGREYSLLLQNFDIANYGDTAVRAEVFLQRKDAPEITSTSVSYSMKTMLQKVCKTIHQFTDTQITALRTMCQPYTAIMADWGIDGLLK